MLVWRCHQILYAFLAKGHLSRLSRQLRLSDNDNDDNEMKPGIVHRYAEISYGRGKPWDFLQEQFAGMAVPVFLFQKEIILKTLHLSTCGWGQLFCLHTWSHEL